MCQADDDERPNPLLVSVLHFHILILSGSASYASHRLFISIKSDSATEGASGTESFLRPADCEEASVSQRGSGRAEMTGRSSEHEDDTIGQQQK